MNSLEFENKNIEDYFPYTKFRRNQRRILSKIVKSFESDKDLVILEAPTGFGKSPVNVALGRYFEPTFYTTPQIKLVKQIARDFCPKDLAIDGGRGDIISLLGRGNYFCRETNMASDVCPIRDGLKTLTESGKEITRKCSTEDKCTYWKQKELALTSDIAVLTFAMLIINTYISGDSRFRKRNLLIIDECQSLESQIASMFAGFTLSPNVLPKFQQKEIQEAMWKDIERDLPKSRKLKDYLPFFNQFHDFLVKWVPYCETERQRDKLMNLSRKINYMLQEIADGRKWVIDIPEQAKHIITRKFKPILVDLFLQRKVWSQASKIILSSVIIPFRNNISAWLERLGLREKKYVFHSVPMLFPLQNRQIITAYMGGKMTSKEENNSWKGNVNNVKEIIKRHKGEKGVIHTQSYKRAKRLHYALKGYSTLLHNKWEIEGDVIEEWVNSEKQILISPAIKEGVDLKDNICRFQILLKVPYPNIRDARVDYLLSKKKDWNWYREEARKDIVQMYGRAIRSQTDYAKFYIVDGSFNNLPKKGFPQWFLDAIID